MCGQSWDEHGHAAVCGKAGRILYSRVATDMTAKVTEKYDKLIADGLCVLPRWGLPEDVGKAVAALATGNFPYTTGQVIMVDGGMNIPRL